MSVQHTLKTRYEYWCAVERGEKLFEVRRDDRGFQKGDILILRRMSQKDPLREDRCSNNSPYELHRKITYVLTGGQYGIEAGYVVLGFKK